MRTAAGKEADARVGTPSRTTSLTVRAAFEYLRGRPHEAWALLEQIDPAEAADSIIHPLVRGLTLEGLDRADEARPLLARSADQLYWHPAGHPWYLRLLRNFREEHLNPRRP